MEWVKYPIIEQNIRSELLVWDSSYSAYRILSYVINTGRLFHEIFIRNRNKGELKSWKLYLSSHPLQAVCFYGPKRNEADWCLDWLLLCSDIFLPPSPPTCFGQITLARKMRRPPPAASVCLHSRAFVLYLRPALGSHLTRGLEGWSSWGRGGRGAVAG